MKKILTVCAFAAAVSTAFVAPSASAQIYVGGGFGSSSVSGVDGSQGIAPNSVTGGNANKMSTKIYAGYQFTPSWAAEAQYGALGSRNLSVRTPAGVVLPLGGSYNASQFSIAAVGTFPLNSSFSVLGKLGVSSNALKLSLPGTTDRGTTSSLMMGVGVAYSFTPAASVRVEYENFGKLTKDDGFGGAVRGSNFSVSVKYAF